MPRWKDDDDRGEFGAWLSERVGERTFGCSNALYVELSLQDASGTAVGFTNDLAGAVTAGQKARLTFDSFGTQGARKAVLTTITCY